MPKPSHANNSHPNNFGIARLVLAMLVIMSHSPELIDGNRVREPLTHVFHTITLGDAAVDGFFLISGFLIVKSWENTATMQAYLSKRILRLYPGFIVAFLASLLIVGPLANGNAAALIGYFGILQISRMIFLHGPQLPGAFQGLAHPQLNSSMWTISYEFGCYLMTILLGRMGILGSRHAMIGLVTIVAALYLSDNILPQNMFASGDYIQGPLRQGLRFSLLFCCGALFYVWRDRIRYTGKIACLSACLAALSLFSARFSHIGLAFCGGYALFWCIFGFRIAPLARLTARMDLSYGLYLYAWPIQNLILWHNRRISPARLTILAIMLSGLIAGTSWMLVERPCLRMRSAHIPGTARG